MDELTPRQAEVLAFIKDSIRSEGKVPTVREIASALGVRAPGTVQDHLKALEQKGYLSREKGTSRNIRVDVDPERLPVLGRIAAGLPIEAIPDQESFALSDLDLENAFMLRVRGESMIEDHIQDGDLVVVRRQSVARNGDIVVAITPEGEATLKRFYREAGRIRLQPANSQMEPIYLTEVAIQGKAIAVIRCL